MADPEEGHLRRDLASELLWEIGSLSALATLRASTMPLLAILIFLMMGLSISFISDGPSQQIIGGAILGIVLLRLTAVYFTTATYESALSVKLEQSNLLQLITCGEQEVLAIYKCTPWPFSLALGIPPKTPARLVHLLARHLSWYLQPPAVYLRSDWCMAILSIAISLAAFVLTQTGTLLRQYIGSPSWLLMLNMGLILLMGFEETYRFKANTCALESYLRSRITTR